MQGVSRRSLAARREDLDGRVLDGTALSTISAELYSVTAVLASTSRLRRSLSDPSVSAAAKARVVDSLLTGKVTSDTVDIIKGATAAHWSQPRDLVDTVETLAAEALLLAAQAAGQLDEVEDELFRFSRILAGSPDLRSALTDIALPAAKKTQLLDRLLDNKATDVSRALIAQAVLAPRGRTIEQAIQDISELAASRRDRLIARVTSAVPLSETEQADLSAALAIVFGRELFLQLMVDPELIGGLTVRVGDEVIDSTVTRQLAEARRRLTGGSSRRRT